MKRPIKMEFRPAFYKLLKQVLRKDVPLMQVNELSNNKNLLLLDAREFPEYEVSHLPGAQFVGFKTFTLSQLPATNQEKKIVIYCSIGWRSGIICRKLMDAGYVEVYNLYGGIFEYCNLGFPVESNGEIVNRVHGYSLLWSMWIRKGIKTII